MRYVALLAMLYILVPRINDTLEVSGALSLISGTMSHSMRLGICSLSDNSERPTL